MANQKHLDILNLGVQEWNMWRRENQFIIAPDLSHADLTSADLSDANLSYANLKKALLNGTDLCSTNFISADLREVRLFGASFINTNLYRANLTGAFIYGISAWDVKLNDSIQQNLIVSQPHHPQITVDNIAVAQFIYLLLNNENVGHVIDTITSKVVLILGRFTDKRKKVLDAIREEIRKHDYVPVLFDFIKPSSQTTLETITTLARMARFVIVDVTDARSVLQELMAIVPQRPCLPIQPIILSKQGEPGMFDFFKRFPWFLKSYEYENTKELLDHLDDKIACPAETKARELQTTA